MAESLANQKKQQELQLQYTTYKNQLQQLAQKIGDIEQEAEEHKLVLETLEPLPGDRKCFRMINGVLVEGTVREAVPALRTNSEGLKKVLDDLLKTYQKRQDEMDKWKVGSAPQSPLLKGRRADLVHHRKRTISESSSRDINLDRDEGMNALLSVASTMRNRTGT
ncbi:MAG: hypothetical protein M1823_001142 [Watsoniomyces obsoletus]|nr:MAG: hypothetical protein M1823_001142 [Watsoniomyces obsoletus]